MYIKDTDRLQFSVAFESYFSEALKDCEGVTGEAMRYATLDGGKRVRPLCVYLGAKAVGGNIDVSEVLPLAAAVELIHSYSLVHDDMPEMDNDEYRRGKLSVHKKYGVPTALLTGDGLFSLAMVELLKCKTDAANELAIAALNMVYGQSEELAGCQAEKQWLDMYAKKTGALITGAFRAGAICAGAEESLLNNITEFAKRIGLAFQLSDDLLDGDPSIVDVIGEEKAKSLLSAQFDDICNIAESFANKDEMLLFAEEMRFRTK